MLDWVSGPGFADFFGRSQYGDFPYRSAHELRQRHLIAVMRELLKRSP